MGFNHKGVGINMSSVNYFDSNNRVYSFDNQETADKFGVEGLTLIDGDIDSWASENPLIIELTVQQQIDALEESISARRWREAYLGDEEAKSFIEDVNSQIEVLRESL